MASILDRLFGAPAQPVAPPAKAVTGPGVVAYDIGVPLTSLSRTPQKLAREAQAIYRQNQFAYDAETAVSMPAAGVAFHVEDENGDKIDETHPVLVPLYKPGINAPKGQGKTRRVLWQLTLRHGGLCGDAFWYADALSGGVPSGFYYINPARMWDAKDKAGNLIGWVMDADRPDGRPPVAFTVDEILHFVYDPADDGHRGIGIVESAWRKLQLTDAADIHAEKAIRSGGRKPGIIMPADGRTFNEDEYQAIVRELRNVTDSPDAAKKSLIFKAPVEYIDAGVAPSQMQLADLMRMGRDDALAHWKVPPSQIGITQSRGLNSGQTQQFEEAALWQKAVQPRLDMLTETLQDQYLDAFGFQLVLHVPTFDDQTPLYELANKAINLPMTNNQRLALVGLPPIDDEAIGNAIYLPSTLVPIGVNNADSEQDIAEGGEMKARLTFTSIRDKVEAAHLPALNRRIAEVLAEQKTEIADRVSRYHAQIVGKSDHSVWWNEEREYRRLQAALAPVVEQIAAEVESKTSATFFRQPAKASLLERVLDFVRHRSGIRIKGINDTTRAAVREVVEQGVAQGLSPAELADNIKGLGTFDGSRAELIARTETGYALNDGALGTYREFGATRVHVYDGDKDEACANANGSVWTLEEAESDPLGHPNCTRDFAPIVKASYEEKAQPQLTLPQMVFNLQADMPEVKVPEIHVPPAEVTVNVPTPYVRVDAPQPNVTVNVPEQPVPVVNVEAAKATGPQEVVVTSMPTRLHKVVRNKSGEATGSVETDGS